jgi:hypothetical protein
MGGTGTGIQASIIIIKTLNWLIPEPIIREIMGECLNSFVQRSNCWIQNIQFIYSLTGDKNIRIGHGYESQTDEVVISVYKDSIKNYSVKLVDTPGFDDSREGVSDTDILQRIVDFLQSE